MPSLALPPGIGFKRAVTGKDSMALLFSPVEIGPLLAPNRIAISPMCQYSAVGLGMRPRGSARRSRGPIPARAAPTVWPAYRLAHPV